MALLMGEQLAKFWRITVLSRSESCSLRRATSNISVFTSYLKMNWNVLGKCSLLSITFSKIRQTDLAKQLGAFLSSIVKVSNIHWWKYGSCRLAMAMLMQILTIRLLSTEHGMSRVDFHSTARVDCTRNGSCRFSRYGSCRLATD